jgi:hypothetical protein
LEEKLKMSNGEAKGFTRNTMIPIEIGTMESVRLGAGTAIPDLAVNTMEYL